MKVLVVFVSKTRATDPDLRLHALQCMSLLMTERLQASLTEVTRNPIMALQVPYSPAATLEIAFNWR